MTIVIRTAEGRSFGIVVPTVLVLNRLTAAILSGALEKKGIRISREQVSCLCRAIHACRRSRPGWKIVEIESKDGDSIEISL